MNQLLEELLPYVSTYGLWIVFFGMMFEGTMMIFTTGVLCYLGLFSSTEVIPVAIAGAVVGDQFWYAMGRYYATALLNRFPSLKQKVQGLKPTIIKKGSWFAFSGRFIYGGAFLFPIALGTYHYPHKKFTLFDILGVTLWSFAGILLGLTLGSGVEAFVGKIDKVWHILLLLLLAILILSMIKNYLKKK